MIIEDIRTSVEILLSNKDDQESSCVTDKNQQEIYEEQIQKLEAEARMHIRVIKNMFYR